MNFLKLLLHKITVDDVFGMAAQLAYFFLLSLFPMLIFLFTLLTYFPISSDQVLLFIAEFAPIDAMDVIRDTLDDVLDNTTGGLLSFGIIATIWTASNGMNALVKLLNKAYEVKETRNLFLARFISLALTILMLLVIIVALVLPVFGRQIGFFLFNGFGLSEEFLFMWNQLRWVISVVILFFVFTALYYLAPSVHMKGKTLFPGALFTTLGWAIVSLGFSYYVSNFGSYSATYGSIGGIIVLMIWFYLTGAIIMIGGCINAVLAKLNHEM
ncbi:YihY/virulence factor BrkB family protein [Mangrovibacillus cuniculi]|uniref:YihY/virulence factor BrkB family protein n=1 Tax=Mangrovibacillus cuniculi TaxID=2593652 RepID=A0A7S8HER7_9BACI|nr:YihY/virulence factor BrkB family protein [Mangrovibacillus cuniculi]QPC45756.1 YihY/virulence factor BrkB family protein [Mangrovibacillus cuniculi]